MPPAPDLSVVVLTWNTRARTLATLAAIPAAAAPLAVETILVDNASADGTVEAVRTACPGVVVVANATNLGYARGNDAALPHVHGDVVCFLNSDARPAPGALAAAVAYLRAHPAVGVVTPPLVDADGTPQRAGWRMPSIGGLGALFTPLGWLPRRRAAADADAGARADAGGAVETVSGAAILIRRDLCGRLGGFDPGYPFYFEDVDLCRRARAAGAEVHVAAGGPPVVHAGRGSTDATRGELRLPLFQGMLRHVRARLAPRSFACFAVAVKLGYVVRVLVALGASSGVAAVAALLGRAERARRAAAAAREHLWVVDHDLLALLRAWGGPATLRRIRPRRDRGLRGGR